MINKLAVFSCFISNLHLASAHIENKVKASRPLNSGMVSISKQKLLDKIKGGWAGQTIGVTFGGPTEFKYNGTMIPDHQKITWYKGYLKETYLNSPGLYYDIYMDLTFVDVMEKMGLDAPAEAHANAFANADYDLWHANGVARYNILHAISPPESGHWKHNPQADAIDFQIEADFAGLMNPAMPQTYKLGMKHTLQNVTRNGSNVAGEIVNIKRQNILPALFEVSHPNIFPKEKQKYINGLYDTKMEVYTTFEGTGLAILGSVENSEGDTTLKNSNMMVEFYMDDKLLETAELPVLKIRRRFDLFYAYNIPKGKHKVKIKVVKDNGLKLQTSALVVYTDTPYSYLNDLDRK